MAPVALNTSKRKFHKLLDSLTASNTSAANLAAQNKDDAARSSATTLPNVSRAATPVHAAAGTPEPPSKRSRFGGAAAATAGTSTPTRPTSVRLVTPTGPHALPSSPSGGRPSSRPGSVRSYASAPPSDERKREPNFTPWSQPRFLARLKTFADVKAWGPGKPDKVGEVAWAKRGWVCETEGGSRDVVACKGGCEGRVVVRLGGVKKRKEGDGDAGGNEQTEQLGMWADWAVEPDPELVSRYEDLVVTGHAEHCLWRRSGCGPDIYRIPLSDSQAWLRGLAERYASLVSLGPELPPLSMVEASKQTTDLAEKALKRLALFAPDFSTSVTNNNTTSDAAAPVESAEDGNEHPKRPTAIADTNRVALALALHGWSNASDLRASIALASCSYCFQRLGLWLYRSSSSKQDEDGLKLDPLNAHREHCPWKNAATQRGSPTAERPEKCAAEVMAEIIKSAVRAAATDDDTEVDNTDANGIDGENAAMMNGGDKRRKGLGRQKEIEEDKGRLRAWEKLKKEFGFKKIG
ncbi:C3HC zinc finger-like-domain-containing protein [Lineolata rhizophorae]|uniref:C3HC zinc finger-like-domain-containing protein n=1 Tax=Lineolata rhizophorae TaxID=578093 RepID=A0A6A6NNQ0_9PEZI|nr:C3HC zinc finger-like-domain-containing protein [Lineolata rhizophorae]